MLLLLACTTNYEECLRMRKRLALYNLEMLDRVLLTYNSHNGKAVITIPKMHDTKIQKSLGLYKFHVSVLI